MKRYRKSDQYYIDKYDRMTIDHLKEIEQLFLKTEKQFNIDVNNPHSDKANTDYLKYSIKYHDTGVHYSRNRENTIRTWIKSDETKDHLLQSNPIPTNIRCNTCNQIMEFNSHDFIGKGEELLFFFSCISGHLPMKLVYPNGKEYFIPSYSCEYCGGQFKSKKKKTKKRLVITSTCEKCGKTKVLEIDRSPQRILPINDQDRKKYCTDFINQNTFYDDLKLLDNLSDIADRQEKKR